MMSSGSTGHPKLIPLTHRGLGEFISGTPDLLPIEPGDTTLNWLPLEGSAAFLLYHLLPLAHGCSNFHVAGQAVTADPLRWLDLLAEHRVQHSWSPNFGYQLVNVALRAAQSRRWDLSAVKPLVSGGEQVTLPVMTEFLGRLQPSGLRAGTFFPGWGMTETCTGVAFERFDAERSVVRVDNWEEKPEGACSRDHGTHQLAVISVGRPAPGVALRILDASGHVLPEGQVGMLQVRSARVTPGYINEEMAGNGALSAIRGATQPWLNTGDLALLADGRLAIVGREKDLLVINGKKYPCYQVEAIAASCEHVLEGSTVACGVPDADSGTEALAIFYSIVPGASADPVVVERDISDALFTRLQLIPAHVVGIGPGDLPRTTTGKIRRAELAQRLPRLRHHRLSPDRSPASTSPVGRWGAREKLRAAFAEVLGFEPDVDASFSDLGLTSVTLTRVRDRIAQVLKIRIPLVSLYEHPSIDKLSQHLDSGQHAAPRPAAEPLPADAIAVVGMAIRFPGAESPEQFWANLRDGRISVTTFAPEPAAPSAAGPSDADLVMACAPLADIAGFDAEFFGISSRDAELTDPAHRLFLECCYHALEDAGYAASHHNADVGVFAGCGMNLYTEHDYFLANLAGHRADPMARMQAALGNRADFLTSRVAYRLGLTGPAVSVQTACSTSLVAVHLACQALRTGDADMALAGAAAVHVPRISGYRPFPGSILARSGQCRAFDAAADGTVGGSGVAVVLLKRAAAAVADGDRIRAVILASAINNDGAAKASFAAPSIAGQAAVIGKALDRAGVSAETIGYVETHGTGTPVGDPAELRALNRAYAERTGARRYCRLGSVKPNIGHLDTCAGMAGLVKAVLMLENREIPPLANLEQANPELELADSPFILATELAEWIPGPDAPLRAAVSSFGFGGTNAHVILEQAPAMPPRPEPAGRVHGLPVLPLSAASKQTLAELATTFRDHLRDHQDISAADLMTSTALGRRAMQHRLAVVGSDAAELAAGLDRALRESRPAAPKLIDVPDRACQGVADGPVQPVAFAFSGQSSARPGMARDLYAAYPIFAQKIDECAAAYKAVGGVDLASVLTGAKAPAAWPSGCTQPAIYAFQLALCALWASIGIRPDFVIGHSAGEYAALCAAGAISLTDGMRLVARRGELFQDHAPAGSMVAVRADRAAIDQIVAAAKVEMAAENGPHDLVVSGATEAIERACELLTQAGIAWRALPVNRAFHSALMAPAIAEFHLAAQAVSLAPLHVPLASTLTGTITRVGSVIDSGYLSAQARHPVLFSDAARALAEAGVRQHLEIGPDAALSTIRRRVPGSGRWTASQRAGQDGVRSWTLALCEIYCHGAAVDWGGLVTGGRQVPLPLYPFQHQRYWLSPAPDSSARSGPVAPQPGAETDVVAHSIDELTAQSGDVALTDPPLGLTDGGDDVLSAVLGLTASLLGTSQASLRPDQTFLDLGADSLALMGLLGGLESAVGVRITMQELFDRASTPRQLADLIASERSTVDRGAAASSPATHPDVGRPDADGLEATARALFQDVRESEQGQLSPGAGSSPGQVADLDGVVRRQLDVAELLIENLSRIFASQLAVLRTDGEPAAPAVRVRERRWTGSSPPAQLTQLAGRQLPTRRTLGTRAAAVPRLAGTARACDFSVYFFGSYPPQADARHSYATLIETARFADDHDFHAIWLPERHFHSFGAIFPNPSVLAAAIARETSRIRLHAGSVVLPLHDPIRVAEEWSVVDNLSGGRVGLCYASGWHANDFVLAPGNYSRQKEILAGHLATVRSLWRGSAIRRSSGTGEEVHIRTFPRPVQARPAEFLAVVSNPASYRFAGTHDLGVVTNLMSQSVPQLAENISIYRDARAAAGLPGPGRVVVLVHAFLGADPAVAMTTAFEPFCDYMRSSLSLLSGVANSLGLSLDLERATDEDVAFVLRQAYQRYCASRALIGSPDSVRPIVDELIGAGAQEIAAFVDFGISGPDLLAALPYLDRLRLDFTPVRTELRLPVSAAQRRLWIIRQMYPDQDNYREPKAVLLNGSLDVARLLRALREVVDRQPMLRTTFAVDADDGQPVQVVHPHMPVDCQVLDMAGSTEHEALAGLMAAEQDRPFDLSTGPLLRIRLARLAPTRHLLFALAHHIVFDSASLQIFVRDLGCCYDADDGTAGPLGTLEPCAPTVPDPASPASGIDFWKSELTGAQPLPLERLADDADPAGPAVGATHTHQFGPGLADLAAELARTNGSTLFMVLLAATAMMLRRFTGHDDFVLGTAVSNRPPAAAEMVGMFVDTLPLRLRLPGDPTFSDAVGMVKAASGRAYDHRHVPLDAIVSALNPRRTAGVNPLFQVMIEFEQQLSAEFAPPGLTASVVEVASNRAPFALSLYLARHDQELRCTAEFDPSLIPADMVARMLQYVEAIVRRATTNPETRWSRLTALTDEDAATLLERRGATADVGMETLHQLVDDQADRTPDAIALTTGTVAISYRQLVRAANALGSGLARNGLRRGHIAAILMPRGPELIVAILAVLKCGAAYLPLDPRHPAERQRFMLADSSATLLLTTAELADDSQWLAASGVEIVMVRDALADQADQSPAHATGPADPAYCIYTSGSTGRPKGVLVPHRGPVNLVAWHLREFAALRTLQWTAPIFDVSVQEIFTTLASGATLVLIDDNLRYDPRQLALVISRERVERLFMPPAAVRSLLAARQPIASLREVIVAGERLSVDPPVTEFLRQQPPRAVYNQYGPTEGTIIVTSHRLEPAAAGRVPIGRPIANVGVQLLDAEGLPVPVGVTGEIYIDGPAVAIGYLNDPAGSTTGFCEDPARPGRRCYRTGDLGRWNSDAQLEFVGRIDDQVKIRGHRVEPGEPEHVLRQLSGVHDAAVCARHDSHGDLQLVCYVVLDDELGAQPGWERTLREQARLRLPEYAVPQAWMRVDRLPVSVTGKVDKSRLPAMPPGETGATAAVSNPGQASAGEELMAALHQIWCAELDVRSVAADDSFFDVGGSSLHAVRLLDTVHSQFGVRLSVPEFMDHPTISAMARSLAARDPGLSP